MTNTSNPTAEQIVRGVRKLLNRYSLRGDVPCDEIDKLIDDSEAGLLSEGAPSEAQVEAAAEAIHNLMQGDPSFKDSGRKREMRIYARAALVAAQGAARPVNGFDTTAERVKTGADSLHVAPQEPNQNETKSGNNFVSLDPEKVAEAERDAALAAIERVRAVHGQHPRWPDKCGGCDGYYPCPTLAALDTGKEKNDE